MAEGKDLRQKNFRQENGEREAFALSASSRGWQAVFFPFFVTNFSVKIPLIW
jgi:hypothetical protein